MMIGIAAMPYTTPAASVRKVRGTGTSPIETNTNASTSADVGLSSPQRRRNSTSASVTSRCVLPLMHARTFQEFGAVARLDRHLEGAAVAVDQERHVHARIAERPHFAEQRRELAHLAAADRQDDVAGAHVGGLCRPARRQPHHDDALL